MCFLLDSVAAGALGVSAAVVAAAGQSDDEPIKIAAAAILQDCLQVYMSAVVGFFGFSSVFVSFFPCVLIALAGFGWHGGCRSFDPWLCRCHDRGAFTRAPLPQRMASYGCGFFVCRD
jgi:hypothetical protein